MDITSTLVSLRAAPDAWSIFGAGSHGFRANPVTATELASFERELGGELPHDYRELLLRVGSGAGPYYGLWSPAECVAELRSVWDEDAGDVAGLAHAELRASEARSDPERGRKRDVRGGHAAGAFPLTDADRLLYEASGRWILHPWPLPGCVPICCHGCTFWTVLVLTGPWRGHVWDVASFVACEGEWAPARRPPGRLGGASRDLPPLTGIPTFATWYRSWLESCVDDREAR